MLHLSLTSCSCRHSALQRWVLFLFFLIKYSLSLSSLVEKKEQKKNHPKKKKQLNVVFYNFE